MSRSTHDSIVRTACLMGILYAFGIHALAADRHFPLKGCGDRDYGRKTAMEMLRKTPPAPLPADTAVLVFIGDVMLHSAQIENAHGRYRDKGGNGSPDMHEAYDFQPYLSGIRHVLEEADIAVANMEFTLAGHPFTGYPAFSAPDSYAEYMASCGIDIFLTANNHIFDKGQRGLRRTMERYKGLEKSHGIKTAGSIDTENESAGTPLYVRAKGIKIALLNFTYGTNVPMKGRYMASIADTAAMKKAIGKAKDDSAELIIALPHWGNEYRLKHSASQRRTAEWLAKNGADIIIGTHPHVIQDCDTITVNKNGTEKTVPVIYSLGNIISNMSAANTQLGLVLTVKVARDTCGMAELLPPEFEFTWCSLPARRSGSHRTVFVKEYLRQDDGLMTAYERTKMKDTYLRVKKETGIKDPD